MDLFDIRSPKVNKYRLFVTMYIRPTAEPSFYSGLTLESKNGGLNDARFTYRAVYPIEDGVSKSKWTFNSRCTDDDNLIHLLAAKIIVTKLPSNVSMISWNNHIHALLKNLPLNGKGFDCHMWTLQALRKLRVNGGAEFSGIPDYINRKSGLIWHDIIKTAIEGRNRITSAENGSISYPLVLDIRGRDDQPNLT